MNVNDLLDKCKEVCGVRTDSDLAKRLGVSKQAMSGYRNGVRLPDTVVCATIAGLSGVPLARVLGIVGEARAISREEKAVWRKLAASTLGLAALWVTLFLAGSLSSVAAYASPVSQAENPLKIGIMRS